MQWKVGSSGTLHTVILSVPANAGAVSLREDGSRLRLFETD
jgi:hypothetical protein